MTKNRRTTALEEALYWARQGFKIVPTHFASFGFCSCGHANCTEAGKHPRIRRWVRAASTDPQTILKWWQKWPDAGVGLVTGWGNELVVLEVETRIESLALAAFQGLKLGSLLRRAFDINKLDGNRFSTLYLHIRTAARIESAVFPQADGMILHAAGSVVLGSQNAHSLGIRSMRVGARADCRTDDDPLVAEILNLTRSWRSGRGCL